MVDNVNKKRQYTLQDLEDEYSKHKEDELTYGELYSVKAALVRFVPNIISDFQLWEVNHGTDFAMREAIKRLHMVFNPERGEISLNHAIYTIAGLLYLMPTTIGELNE